MPIVVLNSACAFFGAVLGRIFRKKISERISQCVTVSAALVTILIGFQMAQKYENVVILLFSLIVGGVLGEIIGIDEKILSFGAFFERKFSQKSDGDFAQAFLTASTLYCVGAMTVLGSIQAGLGDWTLLTTKSILDGFMAVVLAASNGFGTALAAAPLFLVESAFCLSAKAIAPFATESLLNEISGTGGVIVMMIGLGLLQIKKIKTANFLPSIIIAAVISLAKSAFCRF